MRRLPFFALLASAAPAFADDLAPAPPAPAPPPSAIHARTGISPLPLTERREPTGTFLVGAGFSADESFLAVAQIEQPDLFRTGQRLALQAELSAIRQRFSIQWDVPDVLPGIDLHTELFSTRRSYPGFTREGAGGALGLSHRLDKHTRIYARYRVEAVEITDGTGEATQRVVGLSNLGDGTIATLGGGLVHDTLDTRLLPRRGTRLELFGERADRRWGSDHGFERVGGALDHARPLGPFTLRLHGHAVYVRGLDGTQVPLSERLVHDGHADVRGYALETLSPLGDNLEAIGRVEVELPLWRRAGLSIAGWADAGVRHNTDRMWGPTDSPLLRRSAGFSIIWRSPIGPLRFDWAVPLDGRDRDRQFLFNLGGWRW
jgi:outer membrane protein insertion porin family